MKKVKKKGSRGVASCVGVCVDTLAGLVGESDATSRLRSDLDQSAAPPPLVINIHTEPHARRVILEWVDQGITSEAEIIPAAAEETGVSIETIRRYLAKLTSFRGPLERVSIPGHPLVLRRRP